MLLEYRKEDPSVPIRPEHKMSIQEVKAEVTPEGYRFEKVVETLPMQHIIFFQEVGSVAGSAPRDNKRIGDQLSRYKDFTREQWKACGRTRRCC